MSDHKTFLDLGVKPWIIRQCQEIGKQYKITLYI